MLKEFRGQPVFSNKNSLKNSDDVSSADKYHLFMSTKVDDHGILEEFRFQAAYFT
jgi:hypothetical protein